MPQSGRLLPARHSVAMMSLENAFQVSCSPRYRLGSTELEVHVMTSASLCSYVDVLADSWKTFELG